MRIAITTDTHWGYSEYGNKENTRMLKQIKGLRPNVLIHCGDANSSCYPEKIQYWKLVSSIFEDIPVVAVNGNHSLWSSEFNNLALSQQELEEYIKPVDTPQMVEQNLRIMNKYGIIYAPDGIELNSDKGNIYINGMDGWYHDNDIRVTNDSLWIPGYNLPEGRDWLITRMYTQFSEGIKQIDEYKQKGYTTIFVSHFGFTDGAASKDWKSYGTNHYFGADKNLEKFIDNVDYLFYGHSHIAYKGIASNGHTQVINVGSNYEFPKYLILEM